VNKTETRKLKIALAQNEVGDGAQIQSVDEGEDYWLLES
jgi:hypothetical protein